MSELLSKEIVTEVPNKYFKVLVDYVVPYGAGNAAGVGIKSWVGSMTANTPRLFGYGINDAVTLLAGGAAILSGSKIVSSDQSTAFGAGIITSWLVPQLARFLPQPAGKMARSFFGIAAEGENLGFGFSNADPAAAPGNTTPSSGFSGFTGSDFRDVNSVPFFGGAVKGGSGDDFFYNRGMSTRFAT